MRWWKSRRWEERAWRLFRTRFLRDAQLPETQQQIDGQLAEKIAHLAPAADKQGKLHRVVQQASELWANRSKLRKSDIALLAAALLYFISPLDAIPDLLPGIGYVDDIIVVSAIVALVARGVSALSAHTKHQLEAWLDERTDVVIQRLDETAASGIRKAVMAVTIGLWGTTTAAAVSLSVATAIGGYSIEWLAYVVASTALVIACNAGTAAHYWRAYRKLDGAWQQRLRGLVAARLSRRHLVMLGLPVLVLIALGIARLLISL